MHRWLENSLLVEDAWVVGELLTGIEGALVVGEFLTDIEDAPVRNSPTTNIGGWRIPYG